MQGKLVIVNTKRKSISGGTDGENDEDQGFETERTRRFFTGRFHGNDSADFPVRFSSPGKMLLRYGRILKPSLRTLSPEVQAKIDEFDRAVAHSHEVALKEEPCSTTTVQPI